MTEGFEYAAQYVLKDGKTINATGWVSKEKAQGWLDRRESLTGVDSEFGEYTLELVQRAKRGLYV